MSLRGYCLTTKPPRPWRFGNRIGSNAVDPAIRITKLTTRARTGRRMKRSVNDLMTVLRIRGLRVQLRFWREIVVNHHRHSVAQLEHPGADDLLTVLKSLRDRNEIAPRFSDADELLTQDLRFFPCLLVLLFLDHENGITVRRIRDGRAGHDQRLLFVGKENIDLGEHPRPQRVVLVFN